MRHSSHRVLPRALVSRAIVVLTLLLGLIALPAVAGAAGPTFKITGRGYGHGIGLSQWGAQGYAKLGAKDYAWILRHYYQGSSLTRRWSDAGPVMRVHMDKNKAPRSTWIVRSGRSSAHMTVSLLSNSSTAIPLSGGGTYAITAGSGDNVVVSHATGSGASWSKGRTIKTFSGPIKATSSDPSGAEPPLVTLVSVSGPFSRNFIGWRGSMEFRTSGSRVSAINRVRMEQYLYGVVPRESPSEFHSQALRAQAVAARSYAHPSAVSGSAIYCTTMSQVYGGHSKRASDGSGTADAYEAASTNAAVDATAGRLVTYGGNVVQTFFFASSGGRTANIEDVWLGSDPEPYLKSVSDEYEARVAAGRTGYPYISWAPVKMSGSTIGSKLRAKGYGPSSSTAYVTDVIEHRAVSGHARECTVVWSSGERKVVRGDRVRSALGLKSTRFDVARQASFFQEYHSNLYWYGPWRSVADSHLSGGRHYLATMRGASVRFRFTGATSVSWLARRNTSYGIAEVWLDGRKASTVNLYASQQLSRRTVWRATGLDASKPHQVEIKVLHQRDSRSSNYNVSVDAFIANGATSLTPRFEEKDPHIVYSGTWLESLETSLSEGRYTYSKVPSSTATIGFTGTGFDWITRKNAAYGIAEVWVDGLWRQKVDLYSATQTASKRVLSVRGLKAGRHLLRIRVRPEHNPASTYYHVGIDAIDVVRGGVVTPAPVRVQDSCPRVIFGGSWPIHYDSKLSGGRYRSTPTAGSSATVRFRGTSLKWITCRRPSHGKAEVFLDGVSQGVVDLYAPSTSYRQIVWSKSGMADTEHVLRIQVLGTKNARATNTYVGFDALDLMGETLRPPE